jgi:hypothetical protein
VKTIHIGRWKGDRHRNSKQAMRTTMGPQAHADKLERGAAKGEALFARLLDRFPDPDAAIKARRERWARASNEAH